MVGACTGYMDTAGRPIHEGDVVRMELPPMRGTVVWMPQCKEYAMQTTTLTGHSKYYLHHLPRQGKIFRRNWLKGITKIINSR